LLKSGNRFSDKNCSKNKELEHLSESISAKTALEQIKAHDDVLEVVR